MKRTLKHIGITIATLIIWTVIIILGTLNGWWHKAITNQNSSEAYIDVVKEKVNEQFVGNFAMAVFKNGNVEYEEFYSEINDFVISLTSVPHSHNCSNTGIKVVPDSLK